jgi:hypothetical protein
MSTYKKYFFVLGSIYNKTFKMKIVITEEERKHILSSHSFNDSFIKNNLREALDKSNGIYTTETDQIVVGILTDNKGMRVKIPAGTKVWHDYTKTDTTKIYLGNTGYVYYCDFKGYKNVLIDEKKNGAWTNDPLTTRIRETFCNGNKMKTWRELTNGGEQKEKDSPGSLTDTEKGKGDLSKDPKCKTKNPYNAFTDAGLNWRVERQKWIDVKCNGTTPCILGNAQSNINLRNALCDGNWPLKKDTPQTPEQIQACSTKCNAKPLQPGQVGPQVQGWFNSDDNVCYEGTGTAGFASKEECEACKCPKKSPQQQVVTNTATQASNTTTNTAPTLKQFPELIFGDKTK